MNPSYQHYATHDESEYPELWRDCVGAWAPCLGPTGTRLHDNSGKANWGTLTNMDAATDWLVSNGQYGLSFESNGNAIAFSRIVASGDMTFSVWIRPTAAITASRTITQTSATFWTVFLINTSLGFFARDQAAASQTWAMPNLSVTGWNNVVLTRKGSQARVFCNGVESTDGEKTLGGDFWFDTWGTLINPSGIFIGNKDDFAIWKRNLSPSEIRTLATSRGIAYTPRRRRKAYFLGPTFNAAWARGANQFIQPSMIGVA